MSDQGGILLETISRKSLKEEVLERVREYILQGYMSPGQRIVIDQLAKELGVSITPVREALSCLAAEGLLTFEPHKGFTVKKWSRKEIEDLLLLRIYLEKLAVRLFIERNHEEGVPILRNVLSKMLEAVNEGNVARLSVLNAEFHKIIVSGSKNEELERVINSLRDKLQRVRILSLSYPGRVRESYNEHLEIFNAIEKKNVELAERMVEKHILNVREALIKQLPENIL